MSAKTEFKLMTAVENVEIEARLRVPFLHFGEKVKRLLKGNDLVDLAVEDLYVGFCDGVDVLDRRAVKKLLLVIPTTVFDVGCIGRRFIFPPCKIADGSERGHRAEHFRAEARHQHSHMSATT